MRMEDEIPRRRSCRMFRFRCCSHIAGSGCWCIRSWLPVGGSARRCSGRGPAVAGPLKKGEARVGRRKEKRNTLKAARRSMAMAEEEKVAVKVRQGGSCQDATCFIPRCEWRCTPLSSNSSPRLLILSPSTHLEDAWDALSAVFWRCQATRTLCCMGTHGQKGAGSLPWLF